MEYFLAFFVLLITVTAAVWIVRRFVLTQRSRERLFDDSSGTHTADDSSSEPDELPVFRRWLFLAGFRDPSAPALFVTATIASAMVGLGTALAFVFSGLQSLLEQAVAAVPGGVGDAFLPIVWVSPWLMFIGLALLPTLVVRAARRKRVELFEQDLPISLELLATLSEAGLGFDAALAKILATRLQLRPLAGEIRSFQADLLAGRGRVDSLRRLSHRIRIPSMSTLVSALVQAEILGMGISRVLRQQANDMRVRRRERAMALANSLPVKRLFPLVICFLPGLFVWTLGPAFIQLFKMTDAFISIGNF